jgi:hypothetical protein
VHGVLFVCGMIACGGTKMKTCPGNQHIGPWLAAWQHVVLYRRVLGTYKCRAYSSCISNCNGSVAGPRCVLKAWGAEAMVSFLRCHDI